MDVCSFCHSNPIYALELCRNCYARNLRNGSPEYVNNRVDIDTLDVLALDLLSLSFSSLSEIADANDMELGSAIYHLGGESKIGQEWRKSTDELSLKYVDEIFRYYRGRGSRRSPLEVMNIMKDRESGMTISQLGDKYGMSESGAYRIINGSRYPDFNEYLPVFEDLILLGLVNE